MTMQAESIRRPAEEPGFAFADARVRHLELLRKKSGDSGLDISAEADLFVQDLCKMGAYLYDEKERQVAQSMIDYWVTLSYRNNEFDSWYEPQVLKDFDEELSPNIPEDQCPYPGLDPFEPSLKYLFFGRDRVLRAGLEILGKTKRLVLIGPSGSGKSSILRAGIQSALSNDPSNFLIGPIVPGEHPIRSFAKAIVFEEDDVERFVEATMRDVNYALTTARTRSRGRSAVLLVDQFEELFTLCRDQNERAAFISLMKSWASTQPGRINKLVIAVREDYVSFFAIDPDLFDINRQSEIRLGPMDARELTDAIRGPADIVGLRFEKGIIEDLVFHVVGEPAALPLLQFTLYQLWRKRRRNLVTWDAYKSLGGPRAALARSANEVYNEQIDEGKLATRRVFLMLVKFAENFEVTSKRAPLSDLMGLEDPTRIQRVIQRFVDAKLLRITNAKNLTGAVATVEVAHEALIRNWPLLLDWLDEERVQRRSRAKFGLAAESWQQTKRDPGALIGGSLLKEAETYTDLSPVESEFLACSKAYEAQYIATKTRLRTAKTIFLALTLTLIGFVFAEIFSRFQLCKSLRQRSSEIENGDIASNVREDLILKLAFLKASSLLGGRLPLPFVSNREELEKILLYTPTEGGTFSAAGLDAEGKSLIFLRQDGRVVSRDILSRQDRGVGLLKPQVAPSFGGVSAGSINEVGPSIARSGFIHWWDAKTGASTAARAADLVDEQMKARVELQPPIIDIGGGVARLLSWNFGAAGTEVLTSIISGSRLLGRTAPGASTRIYLQSDRYFPVFSDVPGLFAFAERSTSGSNPILSVVVGKIGEEGLSRLGIELPTAPGTDASLSVPGTGFIPSFGFLGSEEIAVRDSVRSITVGSLASFEAHSYRIPVEMETFSPGPWPQARPLLAAAKSGASRLIAWIAPKGISVLTLADSDKSRAATGSPLLHGLEYVNKLQFSADGRLLIAVQGGWNSSTRVRIWDMGSDRATQLRKLSLGELVTEGCRVASTLGSQFLTIEQRRRIPDRFMLAVDIQPCAGVDISHASQD